MEKGRLIDLLNELVEIHNDRFEGYLTASKEIEVLDLEKMFLQFAQTSKVCSQELLDEIYKLGSHANENTGNSGRYFRTWMDVNYLITPNDRSIIIDSCQNGEDHVIDTYEKVLREDLMGLNIGQLTMINSQFALLKNDYLTLKSIRNITTV